MTSRHTLHTRPHTQPPTTTNTTRRWQQLRHTAAELTPHTIEQIAQRVTQLLHERREHEPADPRPARLLDATQLARHLGVTRAWVYEHAHQLGAIRLGTGTKARLRFDLDTATKALRELQRTPPTSARRPPDGEAPRRGRRRRTSTVPLLPVYQPKTRGILARLHLTRRGW
jgi:hypothetical protein